MQFLYPSFLWALLIIAIPIIIHLFHFRRFKNVYFSNIKFLKEIKEETSNRSKLRNLLVLLSRIIVFSALVFAFAQPFLPSGDEVKKGAKAVSIYLDNSFSMNNLGEEITLLEKGKLDAISILEAYGHEDQFHIMTNDLSFEQQQWLNKENAIQRVEEIESTHKVYPLSQIMNRQKGAFSSAENVNLIQYTLSDFQRNVIDDSNISLDSMIAYNAIQYSGIRDANISIDSCWWIAPIPVKGQKGNLIVKLKNYNEQDIEDLSVNLAFNNQNYPLGKVNIPANSFSIDTLSFSLNTSGWSQARVEISDYPIRFDDQYWISFEVSEKLPVLILSQQIASKHTRALFRSSSYFEPEFENINNIDYSSLNKYKLIIFEDVDNYTSGLASILKEYVSSGGNVLVFPGMNAQIQNINILMDVFDSKKLTELENGEFKTSKINHSEFVFKDVFEEKQRNISMPIAKQRYISENTARKRNRSLIEFRDGNSFMDASKMGDGNYYFCMSPLNTEKNDLVKNAEIFVPMLYKMAMSSNISEQLAFTIGQDQILNINRQVEKSEIPYYIKGSKEFIPSFRNVGNVVQLNLQDQVDKDGIYSVMHGEKLQKLIAFNYDRRESDAATLDREEVEMFFGENGKILESSKTSFDLTEKVIEQNKGVHLWKWFLIIALLFLAVEIFLLRMIKI